MKLFFQIVFIFSFISLSAGKLKPLKLSFEMDSFANKQFVVQLLLPTKSEVLDTVTLNKRGKARVKLELKERSILNIYSVDDNRNVLRIIASAKDKITLKSNSNKFVENFDLEGSEELERLESFIKESMALNVYTDSLTRAFNEAQQNPQTFNDTVPQYFQKIFGERRTAYEDYIKSEIDNHPDQFLNLMLVYGLPKEQHVDTYAKVDSLLQISNKNSIYVKNFHNDISRYMASVVGGRATDFELPNNLGDTVSFFDYKGKYILLDFWATWCGPCLRELPHLKNTYEHFKGKNFEVVSVCVDKPSNKAKWNQIIDHYQANWVQLYDEKHAASILYSVSHFPTMLLIDPNGKIVEKGSSLRGPAAEQTLHKYMP